MKLGKPTDDPSYRDALTAEYRAANRYGRLRLGKEHLFFRQGLRVRHLAYEEIESCWLNIENTGAGELPVDIHFIAIHPHNGETVRVEIYDARLARSFLQTMSALAPNSGVRVPKIP